jgi:hypothetical protein
MVSPFAICHSNGTKEKPQEPCHWNGGTQAKLTDVGELHVHRDFSCNALTAGAFLSVIGDSLDRNRGPPKEKSAGTHTACRQFLDTGADFSAICFMCSRRCVRK